MTRRPSSSAAIRRKYRLSPNSTTSMQRGFQPVPVLSITGTHPFGSVGSIDSSRISTAVQRSGSAPSTSSDSPFVRSSPLQSPRDTLPGLPPFSGMNQPTEDRRAATGGIRLAPGRPFARRTTRTGHRPSGIGLPPASAVSPIKSCADRSSARRGTSGRGTDSVSPPGWQRGIPGSAMQSGLASAPSQWPNIELLTDCLAKRAQPFHRGNMAAARVPDHLGHTLRSCWRLRGPTFLGVPAWRRSLGECPSRARDKSLARGGQPFPPACSRAGGPSKFVYGIFTLGKR